MKENIKSFLLLVIIIIILGVMLVLGLDVFGIINLPEKYSIKKFLNYKQTEEVVLLTDNVISYPKEYYVEDDNNLIGNEIEIESNTTQLLPTTIGISNDTITDSGIVYGANRYYYYNQLNTYGKTIYNEMYKNLDNLKTGEYTVDFGEVFNDLLNTPDGEQTLTDAFQLAINAMLLDHPEIFYLDVTKMYLYTEVNKTLLETTYNISIGPESGLNYLHDGFASKSDVIIAENEINTLVSSIINNFNGSTYDKIKQAHNYLIDTITYDETDKGINSHNIYGALIDKYTVCDGYAKAYKYLLDCMGIHCVQVCGTGTNSTGATENHTWNYVLLDDEWYAVDTTWDDPIISGGGFLTDASRYKNFLCGSDVFLKNHIEDGYVVSNGSFAYPILSKSNY